MRLPNRLDRAVFAALAVAGPVLVSAASSAQDHFRFNGTEGHGIIDMVTWTPLPMEPRA